VNLSRNTKKFIVNKGTLVIILLFIVCYPCIASALIFGIEAHIDGRDQLIFNRNTLQWHHFDFAAVGRHWGTNSPTIVYSEFEGRESQMEWIPKWPESPPSEIRYEAYSSGVTR
jgi:hypothetical protein